MARFNCGELPPVAPGKPKLGWAPPVEEHKDYVAPVIGHNGETKYGVVGLLLEAHRFIAINAMMPKDRELAQRIREVIES
jgi:hypothetical protein